jgi:hypothetical protein
MGNKKSNKGIEAFSAVTSQYFLEKYCGVLDGDLTASMTHDEIKKLMPRVQRTSFDHVRKNPELVNTEIIIVRDPTHKLIPYIRPVELFHFDREPITKTGQITGEIIGAIDTIMQLHENATLLIECNNLLNEFIVKPKQIAEGIEKTELARILIDANYSKYGLMVKMNGNLYTYEKLVHNFSQRVDESLRKISDVTDSLIVRVDGESMYVIVNGGESPDLDLLLLKSELELHFNLVKDKSEKVEDLDLHEYRLEQMSDYDLESLMYYCKNTNQMAYYNVVRRELIKRTKPTKQHRIAREKQKVKNIGDE